MGRWRERLHSLEPDLIEVGDPYQLAWAALKVGRARDVPVIGFYHSDLIRLIGSRLGGWMAPGVGRYVANLYKRFDLVLAPSQTMVESLRAHGVERVAMQALGVNTQLFHPRYRDPNLRLRLGLSDDTRLLVFAGRFAREKNIPVLLEAMERLGPRYQLLLVGSGGRLRLPANVRRYPYIGSGEALARLMASCDAFVHAGDKETFGLVILEAMACGVPVVGVAAGGVGELVDETVGMPVARSDPKLLAEAVAGLFERDVWQLGQRCRERVEAGYGWDQVLKTLLDSYQLLTGSALPATGMKLRAAG
jgi:alpha-1,6-mannosyltransferase